MALTNAEAHAVNTLLDYALNIPRSGLGPVPDEHALEAAALLAGHANRTLMAGITAEQVRAAWPGQLGPRCTLADVLALIEQHDTDYPERYPLVFEALHLAQASGYPVGIATDPGEPDWPVAYIELPTGQVSWHMPKHACEWDGHTTPEKYQRIRAYREAGRA